MDNLLKLIYMLGKNIDNKLTLRQLSIDSGVPYTTARRTIKKNKNMFSLEQKGNLKLVSLNLEDNITKNYLIISERNKTNNFIRSHPKFKILKNELSEGDYSIILFGSRAEDKERKKSDIDLCILNKNNINFSRYELLFDLEINPMFLKDDEFKEMLKEKNQNIAKQIIKKHIILYGEEHFWDVVWEEKNAFL